MATPPLRVLNILSELSHSAIYELVVEHLARMPIDVHVLLLNPPTEAPAPLERALAAAGVRVDSWNFRGTRDYAATLGRLVRHIRSGAYDVVHTHLRWASYVGMPAAWLAGVHARVVTRHHGAEHHREHPSSVKYDRIVNAVATHLIAQGPVTYRVLTEWERVPPHKVVRLGLPLNLDRLRRPDTTDVGLLRDRYNPERRYPVIGVISRWIELKGIQYIVAAFRRLLDHHPDALLLLFNPVGNYAAEIRALVAALPERNVRVVAFEPKNEALYHVFDVFVHVPTDEFAESLGLVYAEALAAGVPAIFTRSGIATDLVEHMTNSYVVPYRDADAIYEGLRTLAGDRELARRMGDRARVVLTDEYSPEAHVKALSELYIAAAARSARVPGAAA